MKNNTDIFKKIISHTKEYGFIFQSSEKWKACSARGKKSLSIDWA